ncbi:MAG: tRNA uridine-5-carboxymethylaminomethyl(34) synthesis GTPase MnmE [Betaproteobacteria bacterium]|nr:tRNA uridine-5-carboxymethylaminomethyl(34) synthesis GTPase MnmE [Betaproteobacteria bacterium]
MAKPDLIVAPATASGRGAIGVVRLSGPDIEQLVQALLLRSLRPRHATLCNFLDVQGVAIDQGLAIYFPGPHSYTGEGMLELHGHGGPVVQQLILRRCVELGARVAEPGEFTKRAFLSGRMDLAQAEAVADLIDAQSELAARCAVRSLQGEFSKQVGELLDCLVALRVLVEASMDFPEEGLEMVPTSRMAAGLEEAAKILERLMASARRGSRLRDGAKLVLAGRPNVGKSSLLNRLAEDDVAMVSDIPGTTRDVLKEQIVVAGLPFEILDTAGLHISNDPLEQMGMERTRRAIALADVVLHVTDGGTPGEPAAIRCDAAVLNVVNKIDLYGESARTIESEAGVTVYLSAKTGEGLDLLRDALAKSVGWTPSEEGTFLARERHLSALLAAKERLKTASERYDTRELFAEELRLAQASLSKITGAYTSDDLLGAIFSRYCIGK